MKKLRLKESCTQYTVTRDRYGDLKLVSVGSLLCLYRNIQLMNIAGLREDLGILGIFWFDATATVKEGDIIGYQGQLYRIERMTTAKELLTSNAVHFLKCEVSLYRGIS